MLAEADHLFFIVVSMTILVSVVHVVVERSPHERSWDRSRTGCSASQKRCAPDLILSGDALNFLQWDYIWTRKWTFAEFLYIFTRIMPFVDVTISMICEQCRCASRATSYCIVRLSNTDHKPSRESKAVSNNTAMNHALSLGMSPQLCNGNMCASVQK